MAIPLPLWIYYTSFQSHTVKEYVGRFAMKKPVEILARTIDKTYGMLQF